MLEYLDVQPSPYADNLRQNDLHRGYIYINGVITPGKVEVWMREVDFILDVLRKDVVYLDMCSEGGEMFPALAFYEYVRTRKEQAANPFRVEVAVYAFAASAASMLLLQTGDLRRIGKYGIIHTHSLQSSVLPDKARRQLNTGVENIFMARTGMSREEAKELIEQEHYFTAEEAKARKLIDEIF